MGTLPTVRVIGPKGLAIINESDLELYRSKGFKTEVEVEAELKAKAEAESQQETDGMVTADNLDEMTIPELRAIAQENGIDLGGLTKKADIIETIRASMGQSTE